MSKLNCPNCGAPITGIQCEYCGTMFYDFAEISDNKPKYLRVNFNGQVMWCQAIMQSAEMKFSNGTLPEMAISFVLHQDANGNLLYQRRTKHERLHKQTGGDCRV